MMMSSVGEGFAVRARQRCGANAHAGQPEDHLDLAGLHGFAVLGGNDIDLGTLCGGLTLGFFVRAQWQCKGQREEADGSNLEFFHEN